MSSGPRSVRRSVRSTASWPATGTWLLNWNTAQPLFGYTAEGSEIRELTIDATSRVTARSIAAGEYAAAFVGVCNGALRNCSNMAAVTLDAAATVDGACGVGGLAGLVGATGRVENCSNSGLVTLGSQVVCNDLSIGGVVARTEPGAVMTGCVNDGSVVSNGATEKDNKKYSLYTGGVVGYAGGTVENCTTEGTKSIMLAVTAAFMSYTGGIAGWADGAVTAVPTNSRFRFRSTVTAMPAATLMPAALPEKRPERFPTARTAAMFRRLRSASSSLSAVSSVRPMAPCRMSSMRRRCRFRQSRRNAGPLKEGYIGPRYAYVGGIAGQLMDGGSITGNGDTTNSGAVSIDLMEHNSGAQAWCRRNRGAASR